MAINYELLIDNKGKIQKPSVEGTITWSTERRGAAGKLTFTVLQDKNLSFTEGNPVRLTVNDNPVFYGFVFTHKRDKQQRVSVTAYDQLRYLMAKDSKIWKNVTANDIIKQIAGQYNLQLGQLATTSFTNKSRVEDNSTLFDVINNALDAELKNNGSLFVFYDDFGKLTLKNIADLKTNIVIYDETAEDFDYESTIDKQTYNKINLTLDNEETGKRERFIVESGASQADWGVLQYHEQLRDGENPDQKASALLSLYNSKTKTLKIRNAVGNLQIRAGVMVVVKLALGDMQVSNYMVVERCEHNFSESQHTTNLTLRGNEFVG